VFYSNKCKKGAWLGIFSAYKSIEYIDAIFACIDQLSPNCTGKCKKNYVRVVIIQKFKILIIQDGGGRHFGFTKMLITSAWIELFG